MSKSIKTIHDNFISKLQEMETKLKSELKIDLPDNISNFIDTYLIKFAIDALPTLDSDPPIDVLKDSFNSFNIDLTVPSDYNKLSDVPLDANDVKDINDILRKLFDKDDNRCLEYRTEQICNQDNLCGWTNKKYKMGDKKSEGKRLSISFGKECKSIMKRDGNMRMRLNDDEILKNKYDAFIRILDNKQKDGDKEHIGLMYKYYCLFYKHIFTNLISILVGNGKLNSILEGNSKLKDNLLLIINKEKSLKKLYEIYEDIKIRKEKVVTKADGSLETTPQSLGGMYKKHKTQKRKTQKRKTQKRNTQKRKTQKRKTQKRKTQNRKTQKRKTQKRTIYRGGVSLQDTLGDMFAGAAKLWLPLFVTIFPLVCICLLLYGIEMTLKGLFK